VLEDVDVLGVEEFGLTGDGSEVDGGVLNEDAEDIEEVLSNDEEHDGEAESVAEEFCEFVVNARLCRQFQQH